MQHFISTAGIAGFAIVYGLNLVNGNDPGKSVVSALLAALGFAILTRSFMRKTVVQLHYSAFEQQTAETPPAETAETPPAESVETPPAEATEAIPVT